MKRSRSSKYQEKIGKDEDKRVDFRLKALNSKQAEYIETLHNKQVTLAFGPAGVSKTYIPSVIAAELFANKRINSITIVRPYEGCGKTTGLLPGTLNDKLLPICRPVLDVLTKFLGKTVVEYALEHDQIRMVALEFIRGCTFDDTFVILDEAQNLDIASVKALMTRIGENARVVVAGDVAQIDIKEDSGLKWLIGLTEKAKLDIGVIEFGIEHIVRSGFVKDFIIAMEKYK